jgi:hypothetical protein
MEQNTAGADCAGCFFFLPDEQQQLECTEKTP